MAKTAYFRDLFVGWRALGGHSVSWKFGRTFDSYQNGAEFHSKFLSYTQADHVAADPCVTWLRPPCAYYLF